MRSSAPSLRPVAYGLLVAGLLLVGAVLLPSGHPTRPVPPAVDRTEPLAVLHAWDRDRAAAWRDGDRRALRRLYVPGSRAGRVDVAMLAAWARRGLRVRGMQMQVASAEVRRADDDRIVVLVTDRLTGGLAVDGSGETLALPRDDWSRRRVVLVRTGERWRVSAVTGQARPAARTAVTSGSENS